jgi:hypothetical protein
MSHKKHSRALRAIPKPLRKSGFPRSGDQEELHRIDKELDRLFKEFWESNQGEDKQGTRRPLVSRSLTDVSKSAGDFNKK